MHTLQKIHSQKALGYTLMAIDATAKVSPLVSNLRRNGGKVSQYSNQKFFGFI